MNPTEPTNALGADSLLATWEMALQHFLGKEKAGGSSPPVGSIPLLMRSARKPTWVRIPVIADLMWYREAGKYPEDQRRLNDQVDYGVASDHGCEAALAEVIDRSKYQPQ